MLGRSPGLGGFYQGCLNLPVGNHVLPPPLQIKGSKEGGTRD